MANSSANFACGGGYPSSASGMSNIPLGEIIVAWKIRANYARRKCLSLPGNGGLVSTFALRFPVKTRLILRAA